MKFRVRELCFCIIAASRAGECRSAVKDDFPEGKWA